MEKSDVSFYFTYLGVVAVSFDDLPPLLLIIAVLYRSPMALAPTLSMDLFPLFFGGMEILSLWSSAKLVMPRAFAFTSTGFIFLCAEAILAFIL